jgi:hypothetical protein
MVRKLLQIAFYLMAWLALAVPIWAAMAFFFLFFA